MEGSVDACFCLCLQMWREPLGPIDWSMGSCQLRTSLSMSAVWVNLVYPDDTWPRFSRI
ncbi:hypothetical protein REPUB_Repub08aG0107400 [Reevesia pubescens]